MEKREIIRGGKRDRGRRKRGGSGTGEGNGGFITPDTHMCRDPAESNGFVVKGEPEQKFENLENESMGM